ncbi:MAG: dTDP-4-dehydrorhamnose reductase [Cellulomonas sp.]|uniref:dTDP-4-dehydrorhamnose reductase n=1 Tax=Cellulomonas sp. 73-92 TaxID=1895740 RepID=UPI0009284A55|nr:dTDP-4-dehydrorhamnose reductase [Cellulomonas sp. 73-92]MBN9376558.1 dTDP-4-dehydrorhamnose reductase [Cellulomonas sp.]OJV82132.1 MAG: dTDP-4-dehydrorhamnose reductase [Cellulomonas sp. 73-92]
MRWLVVGSYGMLGQDLIARLSAEGEVVTAVDRDTLDITDPEAVLAAVPGHDVVANCAAFTAVDPAEEQEGAAFAVNAVGAANLARAAGRTGARMLHISTDYVFDGVASSPYAEDAPPAPRSAYGRTKAAGEWAVRAMAPRHLIVRTAWLYGAHGNSFPKTIARVARAGGPLAVVTDQVGQPTWTVDLADLVVRLVLDGAPSGTYHGTSSGETSWYEFARAVVTAAGLDAAIVGETTSTAFVRPAPRPAYSVLGHDALTAIGVAPIGPWRERWDAAAPLVIGEAQPAV